ncbi:MAG: hypothetical protein PHP02_02985 [Eubacteriales bacterium]|nr:hypothetical protein [Eubacteriales bacterium]
MNTPDLAFEALKKARALLEVSAPLNLDCGRLCGAACCQGEGPGSRGGMLLFPGEEAMYPQLPEGFVITPDNGIVPDGRLLTCAGTCRREDRPLGCRLFPLAIVLEGNGEPELALDPRAWPICPLMPSGMAGLSADFVSAATEAMRALAGANETRAFLIRQAAFIRRLQRPLWESGAVS